MSETAHEAPVVDLPLLGLQIPAGADITVMQGENGSRLLVIGPIAVVVQLPLDSDGAKLVSRELTGGIEIASALPVH